MLAEPSFSLARTVKVTVSSRPSGIGERLRRRLDDFELLGRSAR